MSQNWGNLNQMQIQNPSSESIYTSPNSVLYPIITGLPIFNPNQPFPMMMQQALNLFSANQSPCFAPIPQILLPNVNMKENHCNYIFSDSNDANCLPSLNKVASTIEAKKPQEANCKISDSNSNSYCFSGSLTTTPLSIKRSKSDSESFESFKREDDPESKDRVNKSLTEITKNFLKIYGNNCDTVIPLDKCTDLLSTERRRVYDIMNIFEGFGAVFRQSKNKYHWKGLKKILSSLTFIQDKCNTISQQAEDQSCLDVDDCLAKYQFNRTKSLGFLCESFICLLIWKPILSLEDAANYISKVLRTDSQLKTRVRRLYDIANVLCVMKVIKKTLLPDTGKPAFQWIGMEGIKRFCKENSINIQLNKAATPFESNLMSISNEKAKILNNICKDFTKQVLSILTDSNTNEHK